MLSRTLHAMQFASGPAKAMPAAPCRMVNHMMSRPRGGGAATSKSPFS